MGPVADVIQQIRRFVGRDRDGASTDRDLLERFVGERDEAAFSELLHRHGGMVLGVCRRVLVDGHEAEDAFQATFLLLARKAPSIRTESVAGWLGRVAYHLALARRQELGRRRQREKQATDMSELRAAPPVDEETNAVLEEEMHRLPEKYHAPLMLCYVEGLTYEEAARQLRWPLGTLKLRMSEARERLRSRLARRGFVVAATALLSSRDLCARVAPALCDSTLQSVVSGEVSVGVAALVKVGLRNTGVPRFKMAAFVLAAICLVGAGAGYLWSSMAPEPVADGVPESVAVSARLVAADDVYVIHRNGRTPEEYARAIRNIGDLRPYPMVPRVRLFVELTNDGSERVLLRDLWFRTQLTGTPGSVVRLDAPETEGEANGTFALGPKEKRLVPIERLAFANREGHTRWYWTQAGSYSLGLECTMAAKGAQGAWSALAVPANSVELRVLESSEPPGASIVARLVPKRASYKLNAAGDLDEFARALAKRCAAGERPPCPPLEVDLELRNQGTRPESVWIQGFLAELVVDLQGPGVLRVDNKKRGPAEAAKVRELAPGEAIRLPLSLAGKRANHYWTRPGTYTLRVDFHTGVHPAPKGAKTVYPCGSAAVKLNTTPIQLTVE